MVPRRVVAEPPPPLRLRVAQAPGAPLSQRRTSAEDFRLTNRQNPNFSMLALADGRLFCLVVARSTEAGVEQVESALGTSRATLGNHASARGGAR